MCSFNRTTLKWGAVLVILCGFAILLCIPKVQVAKNSGNRQKLSRRLREISVPLASESTPADYVSYFVAGGHDVSKEGRCGQLFNRFGLTLNWHQSESVEELSFYPLAVSNHIVIDPSSVEPPTIQVIMVPIRNIDKGHLPTLSECVNVNADEIVKCQLRQIQRLLDLGERFAATLLSDGHVRFVSNEELAGEIKGGQRFQGRGNKGVGESAGLNRLGIGNARVLQRRLSQLLWPRTVR